MERVAGKGKAAAMARGAVRGEGLHIAWLRGLFARMDRTILITGCSSGIGYAAAHGLKAWGWRVFAACRKQADCDRLAGEGLETVRLDYADEALIAAALDAVLAKTGGRLDALFNNGSISQPGALEDITTDVLRAQFEAGVFGWHELTRRVIPVMRRQGSGRIVNCSSVLGMVAGRFRGAYSAAKFAVEGMTDSLRLDLAGSGIHVILIEPGPIRTRFVESAAARIDQTVDVEASVHREAYKRELDGLAKGGPGGRFRLGPEAVVQQLARALDSAHPRARYRVTIPTHAAAWMKRLLPTSVIDWVLLKQ
jgi:NAD(P)-dependent dehydrogenase (short-subunit alcohol dehydrogenase family)